MTGWGLQNKNKVGGEVGGGAQVEKVNMHPPPHPNVKNLKGGGEGYMGGGEEVITQTNLLQVVKSVIKFLKNSKT